MMFTNTTGSSDSIHSLRASMHKPSATPTLRICIPPAIYPLLTDSGTMCIRHWPSSVSWNLSTRKKARQNKPRTRHSILPPKYSWYDFFAATVDVFGDMPFSEACTLPLTNDVGKSYAHYDKAEDIYKTILDELKEIAPRFRSIPTPRNFNTQDFINNGDMDKWERYANSLRLRLAMRVAAQGDLQAEGRTAIKEILENPSAYPLIEEQENNILIVNQKSGQLNFTAGHGLGDWVTNRLASGAIIDRMLGHGNYDMTSNDPLSGVYVKGEDDPRILLNFNPVKITNQNTGQLDEHRYLGTDLTVADELTEYYNSQAQDEVNTSNTGFSQITQKGFFWENDKFDMLIMASPEIHFLKAEPMKWGMEWQRMKRKRKKSSKRLSASPSRFTTITIR